MVMDMRLILFFLMLLINSSVYAASDELSTTTQNIGVGTVAQSGFKLDINGTARASSFVGNGSGAATMASNQGIGFDGVNATYTTPNLIINSTTGNVAINSTTANQKLEVAGTVKATAFIGDGSGLTGVSSISGLTTNRIVKASSSTAIANSQNFDDGTNVGIGTVVPVAFFDVNRKLVVQSGGNVGIGTITPQAGLVVTNGNVGIGTWVAPVALAVNGDIRFTGSSTINTASGSRDITITPDGSLNLGTSATDRVIIGRTDSGNYTILNSGTGETARITDGNIGVGTSSPQTKLDVNGAIRSISAGNSTIGGNLGIGTTTVPSALYVVGTGVFTTGLNIGIGTASPTRLCIANNAITTCP